MTVRVENVLKPGTMPSKETARLAATAAHFADAMHHEEEPVLIGRRATALRKPRFSAENTVPMLAGLATLYVEALSNIGI